MLPIVSIVGQSKSGKTTLMERLVTEFKGRGLRVAAVKHACQDFEMDKPGKDSWRYAQAGCDAAVITSPQRLALIKSHQGNDSIDDVLYLLGEEFDLVLIEGFHGGHAPKIEVHRKELGKGLRCAPEEVKAFVTDEPLDSDKPQFPLDDIAGIADFIQERVIGKRGDDTALFINGAPVSLNTFTRQVFANALLGMASTLKGVGKIKSLKLWVRKDVGS